VAHKLANAWGLYDMSGNVLEWVEDRSHGEWVGVRFHGNYIGAPTDGSAWLEDGARRVNRGGSWFIESSGSRAAFRGQCDADCKDYGIGFRVARTLQ
jgi:formylglycine-generating enzyme required for sulfatase activity